ncbi:DUF732 domain-containing protein [Myxacorys almedinensis]|uniref:DUF732 domain-containing protein n=1 Tax=Myxacorys almedinensis A TaxID=2690445 RepID=A0A8J8CKA2_9CYAN|nr:DUF732 domain-containing protein [Myxacorys almedinensis]NDJ18396.1 hypothetical protein [Myxacorys almedinensis A]
MLKPLISASLLLSVLTSIAPALAAPSSPDYTCYMKVGNRVIDLTSSVCGFDTQKAAKDSKKNAAFLAEVQKLLKSYGGSGSRVSRIVENNPEQLINVAQNFCQALEAGKSESEFMEIKYREMVESAQQNDGAQTEVLVEMASMAVQVAPKHYCPQSAQKS